MFQLHRKILTLIAKSNNSLKKEKSEVLSESMQTPSCDHLEIEQVNFKFFSSLDICAFQ